MITPYAQVDTVATPYKLVLRTRRYEINGQVYNIIKHFLRDGRSYELSRGVTNCQTVRIDGKQEWGAGLTWKQAEEKVEKELGK